MHRFVAFLLVLLLAAPGFAGAASAPFVGDFAGVGTIEEAARPEESSSPSWWVSSGGRLRFANGVASTMEGPAAAGDRWREEYARTNPLDTDGGLHPQNVFRLVTRRLFGNSVVTTRFRVQRAYRGASPNRAASNGVLVFSRYQSSQTLYYAGLRVDGHAVVKKKVNGTYVTLAERPIYPGTYDRRSGAILLPMRRWIGVRLVTTQLSPTSVRLRLEAADPALGAGWVPLLEADDAGALGGPALVAAGRAGLRTDFLDVELDRYVAREP